MVRLRVRELAEERGFNMSSLSRAANISFNTVKRIYRDPYRSTNTETLERIAKVLGVPTGDLLEDVSEDEGGKKPS
jgi:DNA-binding Xre family transcriptional regulator